MRAWLFGGVLAVSIGGCKGEAGGAAVAAPGPVPATEGAPAYGAGADAVAAYWQGGSLPYKQVQEAQSMAAAQAEAEYLTQRYEADLAYVEDEVNKAILAIEAKKRGMADAEALLKAEVNDRVGKPSDAEVEEAYKVLGRKFRGAPLEQVRGDVERVVTQKKQGERYQAFVDELRGSYGVVVQVPFPDLPRIPVGVDDDPSLGNPDAKVTIIQFADYQCPYCGKAQETLDRVLKDYEGKVRTVFRDFPLGFHDQAIPAAVAANCADKQGKFWPVHDAIMRDQRALSDADLEALAVKNGLDVAAWKQCKADPAMVAEVKKDEAEGQAAGVTGTPAFFINGVFINGAQPYEKFKAIIDRELAGPAG
jgi:protein-disulfide isomerase